MGAVGNCYLSGTFWSTAAFDGITITSANGSSDIFLAKLDTSTPPPLTIEPAANAVRLSWSALATD